VNQIAVAQETQRFERGRARLQFVAKLGAAVGAERIERAKAQGLGLATSTIPVASVTRVIPSPCVQASSMRRNSRLTTI
jgi:hypothetical protein